MSEIYPIPTTTGIGSLGLYMDTLVGTTGLFWTMIVFLIFIITFVVNRGTSSGRAFSVSFFISLIVAVMFRAIGWVGDITVIACMVGTALGVAMLFKES